jgi:predicted short-subunit dehydrogenase-like oxidoreductase (DUF2520 family)
LEETLHKEIRTAVIIGAGNVAWHLGHCLVGNGIKVTQIFNRSSATGEILAESLDASFISKSDEIDRSADIHIIAISDDAISQFLESGYFKGLNLIVHTAGSVSAEVFSGRAKNYGVIYPLQTFTKERPVDFMQVPLLIEANNISGITMIEDLARKLSLKVYHVNSEIRMHIHLAAVIASNFTNHLFSITEQLLNQEHLSFALLKPLIEETVAKAFDLSPLKAQTGPAIRHNHEVMGKHKLLLRQSPQLLQIYEVMSHNIMKSSQE